MAGPSTPGEETSGRSREVIIEKSQTLEEDTKMEEASSVPPPPPPPPEKRVSGGSPLRIDLTSGNMTDTPQEGS